ncbi:MAG: trypsin-like peptidase domain-containing protein, partial [Polyangiaceae bacterium]|nr:trypsin-like peptidase domain-containing protein [Polyangiaceae bacterium]
MNRKHRLIAVFALGSLSLVSAPGRDAQAQTRANSAEVRRLSTIFTQVADSVSPSVVQLEVTVRDSSATVFRWFKGAPTAVAPVRRGLGSGVIVSPAGHIVTNNHVIDGALAISVRLNDGRALAAVIVGRDIATDLAVVKVDAANLPAARFADSDQARVGEWVMAIGSPFGLDHTVTTGVLSAKGRGGLGVNPVEDYLQTDASINPGNSGGPLVNMNGEVIGINTMIVGRGQGIGFAVSSNMARSITQQLMTNGRVQRAWIGVGVQDLTPEVAREMNVPAGSGALINQVVPQGPAHLARLQVGDIATSVAGKAIRDAQDLMREVLAHPVGTKVRLEVARAGKRYVTDVDLIARNEQPPPPLPMQQVNRTGPTLGLTLRD